MSSNYIDVGVYLGGSSLVIAYGKPGESADKVSVIVNEAGDRSTPAVVAINASEFSVGLPAKQNLIRNSANTIQYAKHMIGKTLDQIDPHFVNKLDCPIKDLVVTKSGQQQPQVAFLVNKDDKPYELSLCEAIEKQLGYLNDLAKTSQNVKDCNAVLSVPLYFTASNIEYLRSCAQKAGFNVLRIIKNPIAACLAYDLEDDNSVDSNLLVYQMGGNSIEVTLVSLNNGLYRCLDSIHVLNMGGDQFTDIVVDILCEEFQKKHKSDPKTNKRSLSKLESNAEDLKHILSTMERAHCSIDALYDGIDFDYHITRQRFEGACNKIYGQVLEPVDTLLKRNNLAEAQINQVIICGAATKMCKLQALIKSKFNEAKLLNYQSADEVIALGCAKQCRIMSSSKAPPTKTSLEQDSLFKCLSCPMYLKIGNNAEITPIFKKNTPLPLKRTVNVEFDVSAPFISILESESNCLAKINLSSFKTKDINLMIQIKLNETIEITVIENATNERITIFLNSETNIEA